VHACNTAGNVLNKLNVHLAFCTCTNAHIVFISRTEISPVFSQKPVNRLGFSSYHVRALLY